MIEHVRLDYGRFRRWGRIFIQYCPFDAYFLQDDIVVCHRPQPESPPDSWTIHHTIMRTTWDLDALDTLAGVFLEESYFRLSGVPIAMRSPLAARGIFGIGGGPEPRFVYARNDEYRIEVWDILAGDLAMVVERRVPRRARTDEEADFLVRSGDLYFAPQLCRRRCRYGPGLFGSHRFRLHRRGALPRRTRLHVGPARPLCAGRRTRQGARSHRARRHALDDTGFPLASTMSFGPTACTSGP